MAKLGMKGSYDLTNEEIDDHIEDGPPGNYALGRIDPEDGKFIVKYVGRSDDELNTRLKKWVKKYDKFKFSYAKSIKAAFEKECTNYHDFGGKEKLDNKIHPARPEGEDWECPKECDELDD